MQTNRLVEIVKRAQSGPFMKEEKFEFALIKRIKELVKEHGIKYTPDVLAPTDDDMADRIFEAGLQLFVELGAYCQSTERFIRFSRQETLSVLAQAPSAVTRSCVERSVEPPSSRCRARRERISSVPSGSRPESGSACRRAARNNSPQARACKRSRSPAW